MNKSKKFSPEVGERAVRLVLEHRGEYPSLWASVESIAPTIGCVPQTLLAWVKRDQVDAGARDGVTTVEAQLVKDRAQGQGIGPCQRDSEARERVFFPGGARPPTQVLLAFIDAHRDTHGVEPICTALQVASSGDRRHAARQRDPDRRR